MRRPLIVLRPEPGCGETVAAARRRGLDPVAAPLSAIEPLAWQAPDPAGFDGLLAGSANAFRHGGEPLRQLRSLLVHAVGERTADAARAAGFTVASVGARGLQSVLDALVPPLKLLRLTGEARVALAAPPGVELAERVIYRAVAQSLSGDTARRLASGAVALLHSGEAARGFAAECGRLGIARRRVAIAALAPRIAEAAGAGWEEVRVAGEANDGALLALAEDMCQ